VIIAIDPSINETGWAVGDGGGIVESGVIRTRPAGKSVPKRLVLLRDCIIGIRNRHVCTDAVVEVPGSFTYARSARGGKPLNAAAIAKLNMAIGVVFISVDGCTIHEVVASQWKGKMNKEQANLITGKSNNNESDAILLLQWFCQGRRR